MTQYESSKVINILVSPESNTEKRNSETLVKSLIYNKKDIVPNTKPCGTPLRIVYGVAYDITCCILLDT